VDGIPIPTPEQTSAIPTVPAPTSCPPALRTAFVGTDPHGKIAVRTQASPYLIVCTYTDPAAATCTKARVSINTGPNALQDFNRWTVETGQNAMWTNRSSLNPQPVAGIGILAEWVPATLTFETASSNTWVAIVLTCPKHSSADLRLGMALGRAGLASTA
jgi:hypothetical protein